MATKELRFAPSRNEILDAIEANDWATMRKLSLQPGGLASARKEAWEFLLRVRGSERSPSEEPLDTLAPHSDERQVKLDTDRSFVTYPVVSPPEKERLKEELNNIIVSTLRRYPKLSYFQGYHDIVSVFLLTFTNHSRIDDNDLRKMQTCIDKLSIHRLRDAMGEGLGPLLGGLRILRRLIRFADPPFSELLERISPLPYFALSNTLTLLSHDVPTLSLIQHVFDYLLARPPIAIIYLEAAIILSRKDDVERLSKDDDEGMLHALLSQLPELSDDARLHCSELLEDYDLPREPSAGDGGCCHSGSEMQREHFIQSPVGLDHSQVPLFPFSELGGPQCAATVTGQSLDSSTLIESLSTEENTRVDIQVASSEPNDRSADHLGPPLSHIAPILTSSPSADFGSPNTDQGSPLQRGMETTEATNYSTANSYPVPLTRILTTADALYQKYPPLPYKHPPAQATPSNPTRTESDTPHLPSTNSISLRIDEILGPSSVCFTWFPNAMQELSDKEAEQLIEQPLETVVLPNDGSSDRDFTENMEEERDKSAEMGRNKGLPERKQRQLIIPSIGIGAAIIVGIAAVMLYSSPQRNSGLKGWRDLTQWARTLVLDPGVGIVGVP
ncbi:rab-GTPase-TBC domain-containing protein [Cantharellus anzutake]|uniref:rab-GTPase-TBC domain-containing protein n=1 Tax=Cantharellus anzutake TaxID=1750568 RepID=UPI0019052B19|nr:rab-GTPase-TBC domain-containing protein [Cantharellus anzutake]KAF8331478.1 rab-GTPase-TBC domain-containing protein [Cantharellus anzutake]